MYHLMQEAYAIHYTQLLTGRYASLRDLPPFQPVGERRLPPLNLKHTYLYLACYYLSGVWGELF
jgi:hypothetical protein